MMAEALLILLGLFTGVASGLLGIGGGALMVPGLLAGERRFNKPLPPV